MILQWLEQDAVEVSCKHGEEILENFYQLIFNSLISEI